MKLFFRVSNGPLVHVFQMDARGSNFDAVHQEHVERATRMLRTLRRRSLTSVYNKV